jgi:hypothetical protein
MCVDKTAYEIMRMNSATHITVGRNSIWEFQHLVLKTMYWADTYVT